jgi:hypothetical protein
MVKSLVQILCWGSAFWNGHRVLSFKEADIGMKTV